MNEQTKENTPAQKKILFISEIALLTDLAWKITKEGTAVKFCTLSKPERTVGSGFIDIVDE